MLILKKPSPKRRKLARIYLFPIIDARPFEIKVLTQGEADKRKKYHRPHWVYKLSRNSEETALL